ncbi:MAG: hypothetical protein HY904_10425 [Deltaproteobacteria bacterium]|nr:hypothetical protein [Deltaproteobacteria bacterium]
MPARDDTPRVNYTVTAHPAEHVLDVVVDVDARGMPDPLRVRVPTWVPGAYAFLRYARNLSAMEARDAVTGAVLPLERDGLTAWKVGGGVHRVELRYRVHLYEPAWSELHGYLEQTQAVLLGTSWLQVPEWDGPVSVTYRFPPEWPLHHPYGAVDRGGARFEYADFHAMMDTPVAAGAFDRFTRDCAGTPFHFVFLNRCVGFDEERERFLDAAMKVAERCRDLFGGFPFADYTFFCSFAPQHHWGLEHRSSTMVAFGELAFVDEAERRRALRLVAHELYHAWNVCALKPRELLRPDLEHGSFTDLLWVAEGITRYAEYLLLVGTGEMAPADFLSNVVNFHRHLSWTPAYRVATARDSSLATFLNHHRYPGSPNNSVDYYDVGMLIAFDMDAVLVGADRSLLREFGEFYRQHLPRGFTHADVVEFFAARVPALRELIEMDTARAGVLRTEEMLGALGFRLTHEEVACLGVTLADEKGPAILNVFDGTAAARAGLAPGDQLQRIDGFPWSLKAFQWVVARRRPCTLTVQRGHTWHTFHVQPTLRRQVASLSWDGTDAQLERVRRWLGRPEFAPARGAAIPLTVYDTFHGVHTLY